jgi:hypothetical protein
MPGQEKKKCLLHHLCCSIEGGNDGADEEHQKERKLLENYSISEVEQRQGHVMILVI